MVVEHRNLNVRSTRGVYIHRRKVEQQLNLYSKPASFCQCNHSLEPELYSA